jgi:hypothetical protein
MKRRKRLPWPPADSELPNSVEAIERGRNRPAVPLDVSKEAVLKRLRQIPGVRVASDFVLPMDDVPMYPQSDDTTAARCLWTPTGREGVG